MRKQLQGLRPWSRRIPTVCIALFALAGGPGCASTNMDHLSVTNYADRRITPEDETTRWLATPFLIPLTIVTLAVDNFLLAPVVQLPSAYEDAERFVTYDFAGYYSSLGIAPFQIGLTPVVFAGSWFFRTVLGAESDACAAWGWPAWGAQWVRDDSGRLVGPPWEVYPDEYRPEAENPLQRYDCDSYAAPPATTGEGVE